MEENNILNAVNLVKKYNSDFYALNNVSFTAKKGDFIAITGTSGSGKSTLLHILGGIDKPSAGKVFINNFDIYSFKENELIKFRRKKLSIVYQFYNLLPMLNVKDNILLPIELAGDKESKSKYSDIVKRLSIFDKEYYYPNQLSGGEKQRVAIARALITKPEILLADEPTGNLDSKNTDNVLSILIDANKNMGQTIIIVTHDLKVAEKAKRIIELKDGQIINDTLNSV